MLGEKRMGKVMELVCLTIVIGVIVNGLLNIEMSNAAYRPVVWGRNGMVSSGHSLVSMIGLRILMQGGNAVDAGVAATLATCVLEHTHHSLGGESAILIYLAKEKKVVSINGVGPAPYAATRNFFGKLGEIPGEDSILNAPVPGTLDGLITALDKYGTMSLSQVISPALEYAENGYPMNKIVSKWIKDSSQILAKWPTSSRCFLPGGRAPEPGEIFTQPELAATMKKLIEGERQNLWRGRSAALQAARDVFYRGEIAKTIAKFMKENGGLITEKDLADYQAKEEEPLKTTYKDYEVYSCSTWTQGPVVLQALNILEGFDLRALKHNSPDYIHIVSQALNLAFADRHRYYGDPDFAKIPFKGLMSKEYAKERRSLINLDKAALEFPPGDAWKYEGAAQNREPVYFATKQKDTQNFTDSNSADTIYLCVVDKDGNMFSTTSSNNMGVRRSGVVPGDVGFVLSGRLRQFSLDPALPNSLEPGKRPRITPNPSLVLKGGKPFMVFGTPGEDVQCQAIVQIFFNIVEFGMDVQEAVEAPRFRSLAFPAAAFPQSSMPGQIRVEEKIPEATRKALETKGHKIRAERDWQEVNGGACVILVNPENGALAAGADPRRECYAIGW